MSDSNSSLESRVTTLATAWSMVLAVVTLVVYATGYLALRSRLRVLGIEAELEIFSDSFLFVGAQFFLYILILLPTILLPFLLLTLLIDRNRIASAVRALWHKPPRYLGAFGVLWAVASVQLIMRHVFYLENLLLEPLPCEPFWLGWLIRDRFGIAEPVILAGLLLLTLPTVCCLARIGFRRSWTALLIPLALIQLLLLPIHFGVFGAGAGVDRVAPSSVEYGSSKVWRVFTTKSSATFLVERPGLPVVRRLIVLPTKKLERLEIIRRERLFDVLRGQQEDPCDH